MSQRRAKAARRAARKGKAMREAERPRLRVYDVEMSSPERDDPDEEFWTGWGGNGGLRGSSMGVDFNGEETLTELLAQIDDETADYQPPVEVRYTLDQWPITRAELETIAASEGPELTRWRAERAAVVAEERPKLLARVERYVDQLRAEGQHVELVPYGSDEYGFWGRLVMAGGRRVGYISDEDVHLPGERCE